MDHVGTLAKDRFASIEGIVNKTNTSIEALPERIDRLIDNKMYYPKFRKLIRDGHLEDLLKLTEIAATKGKPSRWFAVATAKANWQRTLEFLAQCREVAEVAQRIAAKVRATSLDPIYKAVWKLGSSTERLAIQACEQGRERFKYFNWLVAHTEAS